MLAAEARDSLSPFIADEMQVIWTWADISGQNYRNVVSGVA